MKKAILLTGAILLLMTTIAMGAVNSDRFVKSIEREIYNGIRTGDLTTNEVRTLENLLFDYEDEVWQLSGYGALTRQEERRLFKMQDRIVDRVNDLMYNRVTARTQRFQRPTVGIYYGNTRFGNNGRYNPRSRRATSTRTTRTNRGGGTYCPPPRRNR